VLPYHLRRKLTGFFREITLPVSTKASLTGYFFGDAPDYAAKSPLAAGTAYAEQLAAALTVAEDADKTTAPTMPEYPELLRWYRFDGSLDDKSSAPELMFEALDEKPPSWAAAGQSYGLSAGPGDVYLLRPVNFFRQGQDQGGGIFLFHIRPVTEGVVFSAFFPTLASANVGVWMDMVMRETAIVLRLKTNETTVEIPVNTGYSGLQGLTPVVVEFYIRPYRFEAKLSLGEERPIQSMAGVQSMAGELRLSGALSGESKIRMGENKTAPKNSPVTQLQTEIAPADSGAQETASPSEAGADEIPAQTEENAVVETARPANVTTIWNEFAILYSTTPLLPDEIPVEETPETQAVPDKETTQKPIKTQAAPVAAPVAMPAVKTEAPQETGANLPPVVKEEAKPQPADRVSVDRVSVDRVSADKMSVDMEPEDVNTAVETEAPLADIQTENIPAEQEPAEAETADEEEAPLLISIQ
jgi:hypothetical protein